MKPGQITIFMILGVVILFTFGIVAFVAKDITEAGIQENEESQQSLQSEKDSIKNSIMSCLIGSASDAVELAGLQGGFFYENQVLGGFPEIDESDYGDNSLVFVKKGSSDIYPIYYHIRNRTEVNKPEFKGGEPYFPYPFFPLKSSSNSYVYGEFIPDRANKPNKFSYLSPLCFIGGPNDPDYNTAVPAKCDSYGKKESIQGYIMNYTLNHTLECILKFQDKYLMNVSYENASLDVVINDNDLKFLLDLPVYFSIVGFPDKGGKLSKFQYVLPVRFRKVYELAYRILKKEASDIFYNMRRLGEELLSDCNDYNSNFELENNVNCFREGINVTFYSSACQKMDAIFGSDVGCSELGQKSSMVVIEDNKSKVNGKNFIFVLAIGNRMPMLEEFSFLTQNNSKYAEYMNKSYDLFSDRDSVPSNVYKNTVSPITSQDESDYDIIIDYNKPLYIIPMGVDPDEDYDPSGNSVMIKDYSYWGDFSSELSDSDAYLNGLESLNGDRGIKKKDANLDFVVSDVGIYNIKVKVNDDLGYFSEQDISLQVRCYDDNHAVDYDFSTPFNPDLDDDNDCCDEAGGYVWYADSDNHKCANCHKCGDAGSCVVDDSIGGCDECQTCSSGACVIDSSVDGHFCNSGSGHCCHGECQADSDLGSDFTYTAADRDAGVLSGRHSKCWSSSAMCFKDGYLGWDEYSPLHWKYVKVPSNEGVSCNTKYDSSSGLYHLSGSCEKGICQ